MLDGVMEDVTVCVLGIHSIYFAANGDVAVCALGIHSIYFFQHQLINAKETMVQQLKVNHNLVTIIFQILQFTKTFLNFLEQPRAPPTTHQHNTNMAEHSKAISQIQQETTSNTLTSILTHTQSTSSPYHHNTNTKT